MIELGFKIVRTPYPSSSGLIGEIVQKIRDDGRAGPVVGDEAPLWDALQVSLAAAAKSRQVLAHLQLEVDRLEGENIEMRRQLDKKGGKK